MINYEQFAANLIQENSLYKTPAERDDFIKDRTRMLDTFYINFFTFIGLFSINVLAPLKKYEQTEGKLLVDNIGDANHDVSLIIKLLYDQKVLSRSVVDNMTKLLVKIKTKQLASGDIKEDVIRKLLTDMQYTSHRGTAPVMAVIGDFADGKIQLKHLAYQLYNLAKKKNYSNITAEIRAVGVYYSAWFKKVGADVAPVAGVTPTPASVTPGQLPAQPSTPTPASLVLDKPVVQAAPAPVVPKTKTKDGEFWNRLFNVRGKAEINALFKEYSIVTAPTLQEVTAAIQQAVDFGAIDYDNLQKTYVANLTGGISNREFTTLYSELVRAIILKSESLLDIVTPISEISSANSKKMLIGIFGNSTGVSEPGHPANQHVIKLTKDFVTTITSAKFNAKGTIHTDLIDCLQSAFWRTKVGEVFTLEEQLKLLAVLGPRAISLSVVGRSLEVVLGQPLDPYVKTYIDKATWESKVDKNIQKLLIDLNLLDKLQIVITSISDFDDKLAAISTKAELSRFIDSNVTPLLKQTNSKFLDIRHSTKVLDKLLTLPEMLAASAYDIYDTIKSIISPDLKYGSSSWSDHYWETLFTDGASKVKSGKITLKEFLLLVASIDYAGALPRGVKNILRGLEPQLIEYTLSNGVGKQSYTAYDMLKYYKFIASEDYINGLITGGILDNMTNWKFYTFDGILSGSQKLSVDSAKSIFRKLDVIGWTHVENLTQLVNTIANKEEFAQLLSDYISVKPQPQQIKDTVIRWAAARFKEFKVNDTDLKRIYTPDTITMNMDAVMKNDSLKEHFINMSISTAESSPRQGASMIYRAAQYDEDLLRDIMSREFTQDQIAAIVSVLNELLGVNGNSYGMNKDRHGAGLKTATAAIGMLGSKVFESPAGEPMIENLAAILSKPTSIAKEYRESVITDIASLFVNADITPDTERAFSKFETKTQKILASDFATSQFAQGAVDEINVNAVIKPRSVLPPKGALKVLKLNRVTIPSSSVIDFRKARGATVSLQEIRDAALDAAKKFKLESQAIVEQPQSPEELEKLSVVYNRYNRYKHGGIAVKIRKVFNVNIGSQQLGWAEYLKELTDKTTYYYRSPQFHGTASLPASMILRYGFSVIDEKLAREAGIKYAGRMLGDGIYSSNVIDKVSQYINDDAPTGVSRRRGVVGYIFEMETQGNTWGTRCDTGNADFSTGGTGEFRNERGGLVSPEWAWRGANSQCRIKRCYEIELINREEMDDLVQKHREVNEAIRATGFKEFLLTEAIAKNGVDNWTSFTFMDNTVPIGNGKFINIDDEPVANLQRVLPRNAVIDFGMYGVTIMFKTDDNSHARLLYGSDIMSNAEIRNLYSKCLGRKI